MTENGQSLAASLADLLWANVGLATGLISVAPRDAEIASEAIDTLLEIPWVRTWIILEIADFAETTPQRYYLAAGPLEDLIKVARQEELAVIEKRLASKPYLKEMLYNVNPPSQTENLHWYNRVLSR